MNNSENKYKKINDLVETLKNVTWVLSELRVTKEGYSYEKAVTLNSFRKKVYKEILTTIIESEKDIPKGDKA